MRYGSYLCPIIDSIRYPTKVVAKQDGYKAVFRVTNTREKNRARYLDGEEKVLQHFLKYIDDQDYVWDVGGNIGVYSIFSAKKGAWVEYFEPEPEFRRHARRNMELNDVSERISINNVALLDSNGTTSLYTGGVNGLSPSLKEDQHERNSIKVETIRGDETNAHPPTAVKIDVEGSEHNVLEGMNSLLEEVHTVAIEVHPSKIRNFDASPTDIYSILDSYGFHIDYRDIDNQLQLIFTK